jgi:glycerophosphoryl diester phosphodiesterase
MTSSALHLSPWPYPCWIAHRGAGKMAPENTLAAFRLGAEHGFAMFECDVKLSADGEPFLLHDSELDRTTNGQGVAGQFGWDALSRLDAGSWHGRAYAGEPLVRLESLSRWLQALGLMVNLEIKPSPGDEVRTGRVVAERVAALWAASEVKPLLSSFSVEALQAVAEAQPKLPRALLLDQWQGDAVEQALRLGCSALVVHQAFLNGRRIHDIQDAGMKALAYTVNEAERAGTLWLLGLDGLITDRVDLFEPQARLGICPGLSLSIDALIA